MENLTWIHKGESLMGKYSGEITMEITQSFKREVEKVLEDGKSSLLVLDLSEISFMDSSGIGFLVACNTRLQSSGKTLVLFSPSAQVRKTLELVQLMEFFKVVENQQELDVLTGK